MMATKHHITTLLGFAFIITGCLSSLPLDKVGSETETALCAWHDVKLYNNFDAARVDRCEISDDGFRLTILPEATPINPSPWYAFRLEADQQQTVTVTLNYPNFKHRYPAKTSLDKKQWTRLPDEQITINQASDEAILAIPVSNNPLYVSAQELITATDYQHWTNQALTNSPFLQAQTLGASRQGNEIIKLTAHAASKKSAGTIMLVGRQHPPEVSGVFAFFAFSKEVLGYSPLAKRFRERFSIVMIPVLNPDGVKAGHWRFNAGLVDLNRDWGPFTQPETQLARDELARIDNDEGLALFLDFHSTFKNVIYTQTDDVQTVPRDFAARWHKAMNDRDPDIGLVRQAGHNTDRPTSKAYVYKIYGVAAITFEMHEEEKRSSIQEFSRIAAQEMMKILLADSREK